ncbi:6372_t:CDS:2 [Ambispora gerdemannii]|uniref:6372_t:CDS:1 n=1 Tax=Ambispora gerdemannii TaxID=144530 RepID=A0A9N8UYL6_9GLOM|nr:6372_t:CDS:2 [Ambispora gerdemannii]
MNNNHHFQNTPAVGLSFHNSHYAVTKQRHYAALNLQLERLQVNMAKLENHVETTAEQLRMIENFGIAQGALFMASNRVLGPQASNI